VREHLLALYEIQKIDLAIRELERKKETIPEQLRTLDARTGELSGQLTEINDKAEELASEARTLEGQVQEETHKIRKWEARLKDIRNQREFQALLRETEGLKRLISDNEDKILEIWEQKKALDGRGDELQRELDEVEIEASDERDRVREQLGTAEHDLQTDTQRREELRPEIETRLWRRYEMVRKKRKGVGLVLVQDGSCLGCNVKLRPQLYNTLQRGDTVEECPQCHRFLLWDGLVPGDEADASESAVSS